MRIRVKFSKYEILKFIGHLDVMRFFQKAIRRSGIDIAYSKGFSPHQIMSFAAPLGIGITSDGEYMDIELSSYDFATKEEFLDCLNQQMTEGFLITDIVTLSDPKPNQKKETAMSQVAAADYKLSLKHFDCVLKNGTVVKIEELQKYFLEFMNQECIFVQKHTKKEEQLMDLRPYIFSYSLSSNEFSEKNRISVDEIAKMELHAMDYGDTFSIYLRLAAGSIKNIKPELVIEAFMNQYGFTHPDFFIQQHRMELYKKDKTDSFIPLICQKETKEIIYAE